MNKNRRYQNILSCGGRESDGWIFRTVIRQSRLLRICGGSEVVTRFFQASSQSSHTRAEGPTRNRLHRQTGYDARLVSEARRSEIRRLEETPIGWPRASRCDNRRAGGKTGA